MRSSRVTALWISLAVPCAAWAGPFDDTLWLGTDNTSARDVLNTDRSGNLLRSVPTTEASGIAIDLPANIIYLGTSAGVITGRSLSNPGTTLTTIHPATVFGEDMAFDGTDLWRVDIVSGTVDKIDPVTGAILFTFSPGFTPLGLAWDGKDLWVSEFTANGLVEQFTTAGAPTGNQFLAPLLGNIAGGLAWDTTDNTLWIGSFSTIYHTTTTGTLLGSFPVPVPDGRFVDGLEFQGAPVNGAVPEPSTLLLLACGVAAFMRRRRAANT